MGIRESLLNTITSVGNGDFIRIVTSAGASSKATLANVFKSFESGLGAKSNLNTTDYIRVVGSDNNSYKQPMTDLMSTTGIARDWTTTGVDFNTLTPNATLGNGYYRGNDISTMTNRPSAEVNSFPWALDAINVNSYIKQILHVYAAQANIVVYERIQRYSSGSTVWGNWEKMPTRAEVDALKSNIKRKIVNYRDITIPASGYVSLDSYASLGVSTSWYLLAMSIRGWSGNEVPRIAKGGSGTEIYAVGTPGTYEYFGVEYYFAVSAEAL